MAGNKRLFWEHGTLLQPQHFQCLEDRITGMAAMTGELASPWPWGVRDIHIQEEALALSHCVIDRLEILLPGGELAILGTNAVLGSRNFAEHWPEQEHALEVRVGLAPMLEYAANVTECDINDPRALASANTRFVAEHDPGTVPDILAGGEPADVRFMRYNLQLLFSTETEKLATMPSIPVARLVREGDNVSLSRDFCPPCVAVAVSPIIMDAMASVRNAIVARAKQLEDFKILPGLFDRGSSVAHAAISAQTMTLYSMLKLVTRHAARIEHYCEAPALHPWNAYGLLREIVGDLSLFTSEMSATGCNGNGERILPAYDHNDLGTCFATARMIIIRLLECFSAGPAHTFPLENNGPVWFCRLPAHARAGFDYWLQVRSTNPESVREQIAAASKFAPESQLQALVAKSLPGIRLFVVDQPPPGLPQREDTCYFAIDQRDPLWTALLQSGDPALFVGNLPEGTSMNLLLLVSSGGVMETVRTR